MEGGWIRRLMLPPNRYGLYDIWRILLRVEAEQNNVAHIVRTFDGAICICKLSYEHYNSYKPHVMTDKCVSLPKLREEVAGVASKYLEITHLFFSFLIVSFRPSARF